jgi:hypothetical protein
MLSPEGNIGLALVTGTLVVGIFSMQLSSPLDVRTVEAGDADVEAQERNATWMAAVAVSGISLIAKSPETFTVGGLFVVGMAWTYRHANAVSPLTKKAAGGFGVADVIRAQMPGAPEQTEPASAVPVYSAVI